MLNEGRKGLFGFTIVWFGQVISLTGTGMTRFALTIWAWQITGKASALAMVAFFSFAPAVLITPIAGALVDRYNRKLSMMLSDLAAVVSTLAVLILFLAGRLQVWHLYVTGAFAGFFGAFQFPAYSAAITLMVPKKEYARASGMLSMAEFGSMIFSPILAAFLLSFIEITGILLFDLATFMIAIFTLLVVTIPQPPVSQEGAESRGNLWRESTFGFKYIYDRPGLLGLQLVLFFLNLFFTMATTLFSPMILARTNNNTTALGIVESAIGVGGVAGGVFITLWGGPKRRIHGVLGGVISSMLGVAAFGFGQSTLFWMVMGFLGVFFLPMINASNQAIWQVKIPPDLQGRVFSVRGLIAQISSPLAMLISGPLADNVFEPAMMPEGSLSKLFGGLIGTGPGAGMSLIFIVTGLIGVFFGLGGYAFREIRNVEDNIPDYEMERENED
jgi:MFS family permease